MPSSYTTTQGQAWDQIAKERIGSEKQMGQILPCNVEEMDALFLAGGKSLVVPEVKLSAVKSLPPWERL